jgi:thiol-disulfide isomerase/thioredoxin
MDKERTRALWRRYGWIPLVLLALAAVGVVVSFLVLRGPDATDVVPVAAAPAASPPVPPAPSPPLESAPLPSAAPAPGAAPSDEIPVGIEVGMRAPSFSVDALAGGRASLSNYQGKLVILDFWASWCGPCKASMPVLESLAKRYKDRGLVLLGLSVDRNPDTARQFLADNGYTDLVALWESPAAAPMAAHTLYRIRGIPHTFIIDRNGIVLFAGHPARLSVADLERWLQGSVPPV